MGKMFLIVIDAHSKWMDVHMVSSATAQVTIEKLRSTFATLGLPEVLVTDNGTTFTSADFERFCTRNGIQHLRSSPYHPATNGLAERAVQTFKKGLKKLADGSLETRLARFLFSYRTMPQTTTGLSPAELLFGRRLRTQLDLLQPDLRTKVQDQQQRMKTNHDQHAQQRCFSIGDLVLVRNYGHGPVWLPGVVSEVRGPVSYVVTFEDGRVMHRHVDLLRPRWTDKPEAEKPTSTPHDLEAPVPLQPTATGQEPEVTEDSTAATAVETATDNATDTESGPPEPRRSSRQRRPPDRFGW